MSLERGNLGSFRATMSLPDSRFMVSLMDDIDLRGGEGLGTNLDGRNKLFQRKNHARQKRSCLRGFWAVLVV